MKKICPKCNYYMEVEDKTCLNCKNRGELNEVKE